MFADIPLAAGQKRRTIMEKTTQRVRNLAIAVAYGRSGRAHRLPERGRTMAGLIYEGFGNYERTISTESESAQQWFNQGMQLMYGFNHDEAIRSFEQAAVPTRRSPMPWWGIAYCNGININDPEMTDERSRSAWEASQKALERIAAASPVEAALIEAVAERYAWPARRRSWPALDHRAMPTRWRRVYEEFPNDPDVAALFAEALMDLQPWDYWTDEGEPRLAEPKSLSASSSGPRDPPAAPGCKPLLDSRH